MALLAAVPFCPGHTPVRTRSTHAAPALTERAQVRISREFGLVQFSGITPSGAWACAGTKWDSSEKGQLRPGLSESIAASLLSRRTGAPAARAIKALHRDTRGNTRQESGNPGRTSLVRALALHGVLRPMTASHLASPLGPGRGVLIRSVSRRLGSVAYVREDASPNEVSRFQPHPGCRCARGVSNFRPGQADGGVTD